MSGLLFDTGTPLQSLFASIFPSENESPVHIASTLPHTVVRMVVSVWKQTLNITIEQLIDIYKSCPHRPHPDSMRKLARVIRDHWKSSKCKLPLIIRSGNLQQFASSTKENTSVFAEPVTFEDVRSSCTNDAVENIADLQLVDADTTSYYFSYTPLLVDVCQQQQQQQQLDTGKLIVVCLRDAWSSATVKLIQQSIDELNKNESQISTLSLSMWRARLSGRMKEEEPFARVLRKMAQSILLFNVRSIQIDHISCASHIISVPNLHKTVAISSKYMLPNSNKTNSTTPCVAEVKKQDKCICSSCGVRSAVLVKIHCAYCSVLHCSKRCQLLHVEKQHPEHLSNNTTTGPGGVPNFLITPTKEQRRRHKRKQNKK